MKRLINVRIGEGDSQKTVEAVLWIEETPPNCRRGKQRERKSRKYKQRQQALIEQRRQELREELG